MPKKSRSHKKKSGRKSRRIHIRRSARKSMRKSSRRSPRFRYNFQYECTGCGGRKIVLTKLSQILENAQVTDKTCRDQLANLYEQIKSELEKQGFEYTKNDYELYKNE